MTTLLKLYMGNASGSQSFTIKPGPTPGEDAGNISQAVYELVKHGNDTTWQLGEASEVPDGGDFACDATSAEVLSSVIMWLS
jgi:hypothetical protein